MKQSNPTEIRSDWLPWGDDVAGWLYTQQTYDWQGRPLVTTNTDGTTKEASYGGCGCAGGAVVTLTDEGTINGGVAKRRQQKIYSDVLGRTVKTEVLNWQGGSVYSATVNTYNARDQIEDIKQYAGAEGSGTYQQTVITYDGHGRLKTRKLPEQSVGAATVYDYNADDTVQKITDSRGASQTFSYNNRHFVTGISYSVPGGSNIPLPGNVSFNYDAAGNRTQMADGTGSTTYQYNSLSRLTSETRQFNGLTGSFSLTYAYNLSGQVSSFTDSFGATVGYSYDASGRLNAVTGAGYAGVSQYASGFLYRAWDGLKRMSYGNNPLSLQLGYNSRLQPTTYEVSGNTQYGFNVAAALYQYYADGSPKYAQDQLDARYDRAYQLDQLGRLSEAYSGTEARDFINGTNSGIEDGPYRQSYQYNAWSNLTSRTNRFWSGGDGFNASYLNNRRSGWGYNADGQVTSTLYTYDAVGRNTFMREQNSYVLEITQSYDGDGQRSKRIEMQQGQFSTTTESTYYLRSSVFAGAVVTEINGQGQKVKGKVYAGGQLLATQQYDAVLWSHRLPVSGSDRQTGVHGWVMNQEDTDPMGASIGYADPYQLYQSPDYMNTNSGGASLYNGSGNPFDSASGCTVNGMPLPCDVWQRMLENGAFAIQDPRLPSEGGRPGSNLPLTSRGLGGVLAWIPNPPDPRGPGESSGNDDVIVTNIHEDDRLGHWEFVAANFGAAQSQTPQYTVPEGYKIILDKVKNDVKQRLKDRPECWNCSAK